MEVILLFAHIFLGQSDPPNLGRTRIYKKKRAIVECAADIVAPDHTKALEIQRDYDRGRECTTY